MRKSTTFTRKKSVCTRQCFHTIIIIDIREGQWVHCWCVSTLWCVYKPFSFFYYYCVLFFALCIHFINPFWVRLQQPQQQRYPVLQVHAGSFRVSIIHQTLTWTTWSLTCVRDQFYACVYTQGLQGTPAASQQIFDSEKLLQICYCADSSIYIYITGMHEMCCRDIAMSAYHVAIPRVM